MDVIYLLNRATTLGSGNTPLVVDLYNYMAERFKGYSPIVVDASRITPYTPNPTDNGCVPHTPDLIALWTVSILTIAGVFVIGIKHRRLV